MKRPLLRKRGEKEAAAEEGGGLYFSSPKTSIQFIRSGCTMLDLVLGGGWALGRVANIVGDKSTGKTLLAMEAIANLFRQYAKARARYNEAEGAFDADYARALGIPMDRVDMCEDCNTVEALYKDIDDWLAGLDGQIGLYILDSLDALSDSAEMERDIGEGSYGAAKAKKLSEFFRRKSREMNKTNVCLIVVSQIRDNIGAGIFGKKWTRSGGRALDFYASQILYLAHIKTLKRTVSKIERPVGVHIKAKSDKCKVGLPFRECEFDISFGYGIEDEKASREWLAQAGGSAAALKLSGEELRAAVTRRWFEVEKTFLPAKSKYAEEGSEA